MKKKTKSPKVILTQDNRTRKMSGVHSIVVDRMKQKGVSIYALAKMTGLVEQTVRDFIKRKTGIRSDKLEPILKALELEIRPKE